MMKKMILISMTAILVFVLCSCSNDEKTNKTETKGEVVLTENFDWLLGKWERANEEEGKQTFENWEKVNHFEYEGFGWTVQNNDTIFQEKLKLNKSKNNWILGVIAPEETNYTNFKVVQISKESFTCENPEIDFPNTIKYWKDGEEIKVFVSGKDMEITFEFTKLNLNKNE
jgi:hypothetical protein